ncbi:unnamed protein product, partial [Laminaria digitata]
MFGLDVIQQLLPHRPPFLMVESVVAYTGGDTPLLNAEQSIRRTEPLIEGTESSWCWPAVYVIEGLGQSCILLNLIGAMEQRYIDEGLDSESIIDALNSMQTNRHDHSADMISAYFEGGVMQNLSRIGLLASVDIEVKGQVKAGGLLSYEVHRTHVFQGMARFSVR